ncbi:hypothetical protein BH10PSE15_BH10PSE15_03320 [soil metagenome]
MEQDRVSQVRSRAHAIWIAHGMPDGEAAQHWAQAEAEFEADEAMATITPASAVKPAPTPARKAPRRKVSAASAPDVGAAPTFETPAEPPVPPDVIAIVDPPAAPKKPVRRKAKS